MKNFLRVPAMETPINKLELSPMICKYQIILENYAPIEYSSSLQLCKWNFILLQDYKFAREI